ncbi:hypothetical protein IHE44_0003607 [Lamprotornis superbus]|uniref:Major facilitator superfamily (MFS) profile domain-containing protein n=1 Tax=Lamprotornis superbus TaxID=245042 RepID=A0A835NZK4_9PASS|nr:hypothetical protein IHE44_0003607 [Lamprotornis superbus]
MGAFVSIGFAYAFPKGLAIFFKEIQDFFGTSYSEIAWVSSIMLATTYGAGCCCANSPLQGPFHFCKHKTQGPISSILVNRYGSRPVVMLGGLLCGVGMISAAFCTSILQLYICVGFITGALFRPIGAGTAPVKTQVNKEEKDALKEKVIEDGPMEKKIEEEEEKDCFEKVNQYLDFSLFKHRGFLIYLIGNVLMFLGFFAPIVFLAPYAKHTGIDEYSAAFLLSILAIVDMVARPATGIIANSRWVRPRIQYFFSFAIAFNGACHLLCPLASSYTGLIVYSSFYGLAFGMVCAMLFETLMDLVGAARFTSAVGLVTIAECCTILLGPPIGAQ